MSARPQKKSRKSGDSSAKIAKLSEPLQEWSEKSTTTTVDGVETRFFGILKFFQSRPDADAFTEAVDWEAFGLNDYPEIITHPMDLGTVQTKLEDGKYGSPADFAKDMRLIWKNAMTYNRPDSDIFETAEKLAKLFEKKIAKIKSNKKARTDGAGAGESSEASREVTRAERLSFSSMVSALTSEQLGSLVQMIQKECPEAINDDDEEELEIEINNLDPQTLGQLNAFCHKCVDEKSGGAAGGADVKKEGAGAAQKKK